MNAAKPVEPSARFDDLTPGGPSFVLEQPSALFIANTPSEVIAALRDAETAARDGVWVAGFVTYEAASGLDSTLKTAQWPAGHALSALPLVHFAAYQRRTVVSPPTADPRQLRIDWVLDRDVEWHRRSIAGIRAEISDGDYYQLNLTARLVGRAVDPVQLYGRLCAAQRGRHHALIRTGMHSIISGSPELFFERNRRRITMRPMKGTAPRGRWAAEDTERREGLLASAKERAENAMIVDLLRNDLARLADIGTVRVPSLFAAERYPTVWQLTSTVEADTDADLAATFTALFPSGSVTGAPKRAAMAAIRDYENRPRGVYCGAVGYLEPGPTPRARFSVAIRTAVAEDASGYVEYGTGGGITWPSAARAEWAELVAKTRVLQAPPRPVELLETLRFEPGRGLVNLRGHLTRLESSADYFGFNYQRRATFIAIRDAFRESLFDGGRANGTPARVRILARHDGAVNVEVLQLDIVRPHPTLALARTPIDSADCTLFHKFADRRRYLELRAENPGVDDVVLWNERGEVTETTIANLAVLHSGRWWTPPVSCGLLPGIERARLLDAGLVSERVVTIDEFASADRVAVFNSLRGWRTANVQVTTDAESAP